VEVMNEPIIAEIEVESYSQQCTLRFHENKRVSLSMPTEEDEYVAYVDEHQKLVEFLHRYFTDFEKIRLYTKISREIRKSQPPVSTILFDFLNQIKN
jgi:sulfur relay (sulfurtransferase) DsrC/TusE family protein